MKILQNTRRTQAKNNFMPSVLALLLTFMFGGAILALFIVEIPAKNESSLLIMFGALQTAWLLSMNYYYISTSGSKAKDALLADSIPVQRSSYDPQ